MRDILPPWGNFDRVTLQEALQLAVQHHQAGRFADAESIYRQILDQHPGITQARVFLSLVLIATGRSAEAIDQAQQAVAAAPQDPGARFALADALLNAGQHHDAIEHYRAGLTVEPQHVTAWINLAFALLHLQRPVEAIEASRAALKQQPELPEAYGTLADAFAAQEKFDEAVEHARHAIRLLPKSAHARLTLGNVHLAAAQFDDAIAAFEEATQLMPDLADAHNNLGIALMEAGRGNESLVSFERAVRLRPKDATRQVNLARSLEWLGRYEQAREVAESAVRSDPVYADGWNQLAIIYGKLNEPQRAIEACRKALAIDPKHANARTNLGIAFKDQGYIKEAVAEHRLAVDANPDHATAWSNLLYVMHLHPDYDGDRIRAEHVAWAEKKADPLPPASHRFSNDRNAERPLRIAYVSPDLRGHPVGNFMLPLLTHHNRRQVHITCYADVLTEDSVSAKLRGAADMWRNTRAMKNEALFEQIRRDGIDILVDLTLHSAGNRMLVFARKPAPVQATYLGYPSTTGLAAMDWRFTDRLLDPGDQGTRFYTERPAYLETTYWCYHKPRPDVRVALPPARSAGRVTFGCFNNFGRVTDAAIAAWARILKNMPTSRLILHADPGGHRQRVLQPMAAAGIAAERIEFVERAKLAAYFESYSRIDIALDPFPYCGATTTCDALWMGVPVISLVGDIAVRRAGLSILSRVGLADLAVDSVDAYVRKAIDLARDVEKLAELRRGLRDRMLNSPLMDAASFARDVERLYRMMWIDWVSSERLR